MSTDVPYHGMMTGWRLMVSRFLSSSICERNSYGVLYRAPVTVASRTATAPEGSDSLASDAVAPGSAATSRGHSGSVCW